MFRITCYTLFDITQTNVLNRAKPDLNLDYDVWLRKRNSQSNFDTILQVINLRSQPENISIPLKFEINFDEVDYFGFLYQQLENETYPAWMFNFEIADITVFKDEESDLGNLYKDCMGVPITLTGVEWNKLPNFLDVSPELKNIYFKVNHE